jgi:hypothetical protein
MVDKDDIYNMITQFKSSKFTINLSSYSNDSINFSIKFNNRSYFNELINDISTKVTRSTVSNRELNLTIVALIDDGKNLFYSNTSHNMFKLLSLIDEVLGSNLQELNLLNDHKYRIDIVVKHMKSNDPTINFSLKW